MSIGCGFFAQRMEKITCNGFGECEEVKSLACLLESARGIH